MVITKSISRFARNTVTLLEAVRELKALGIDVYFEEQNIYTLDGSGQTTGPPFARSSRSSSLRKHSQK